MYSRLYNQDIQTDQWNQHHKKKKRKKNKKIKYSPDRGAENVKSAYSNFNSDPRANTN